MKKWADKKRWHGEYRVGDLVLVKLLLQQFKFKSLRPVHKGLVRRYEDPSPILGRVDKVSYRVELPLRLKICHVFHVSYLKPYHEDKDDPSQGLSEKVPTTVVTFYDAYHRRLSYKEMRCASCYGVVKWKGLPKSQASREHADSL